MKVSPWWIVVLALGGMSFGMALTAALHGLGGTSGGADPQLWASGVIAVGVAALIAAVE